MGEFSSSWPRASKALEEAVLDLLSGDWDEDRRRRAYDMALVLTQAAKIAGCWEMEAVLRPLCALLGLSVQEVGLIRQAVRDKLIELLGLMKASPASRSA